MMNANNFGGVIAVLVTPYRENGEIDPEGMTSLCRRVAQAGCQGVFVAGSTGDMPLLNREERVALVEAARRGCSADMKIYAGVTDYSLGDMVENARRFADVGADVAVVMPPLMFFKYSEPEMTAYFRTVADQSVLPVLMYNHMRLSTPVYPETIRKLMSHPNILGMKETWQTIDRTLAILEMTRDEDFLFIQGREAFALESLRHGAQGLMAALGNVAPEYYVQLWHAFRAGDEVKIASVNEKLDQLCGVFDLMPMEESFSYFGYTLKKMMQYRGWSDNANNRIPGFVPDPRFEEQLFRFLREIDFPTCSFF
ncbi:MAG: dihydrodipicolinate synthase family protein [Planctomycetia bacterium]|nr:dihydrodipicolinate synthase family protein [Planctomycetia bacterium]